MNLRWIKRKISFRMKIAIIYSISVSLLVVIVGISFYSYYVNAVIEEDSMYMDTLATNMLNAIDDQITFMDYTAVDLISDPNLIKALSNLKYVDRTSSDGASEVKTAISVLNSVIIRSRVTRNDFRVNLFTEQGDYFTSSNIERSKNHVAGRVSKSEWTQKALEKKGKKVIIPEEYSIWGDFGDGLFSLVRVVLNPGIPIGYLEVTMPFEAIEDVCTVENSQITGVFLYHKDGTELFNYRADLLMEYDYYVYVKKDEWITNPRNQNNEFVTKVYSEYSELNLTLVYDKTNGFNPISYIKKVLVLISLIMSLVTFFIFYGFSWQLTKPLKVLTESLRAVHINNLPNEERLHHPIDEIELLSDSFNDMKSRLSIAIEHEIESRTLQMRAHFDALQAQINPHFIHNMMNVVANMGMEAGCADIAEVARAISSMLRYASDTENRTANVGEEIDQVKDYLFLMKKRFEHKLDYNIEVQDELIFFELPKMVIQPLVENAITHGINYTGHIHLWIKCERCGNKIVIIVSDNGGGFNGESIAQIKEKILEYNANLKGVLFEKGMMFGGLGLLNTYIRMKLYFDESFQMDIKNIKPHGARVVMTFNHNNESGSENV